MIINELKTNNNSEFKLQFRKRCFEFSLSILKISLVLQKQRINWNIINQVIRAGTSIGANVVEGSNSTSKKEFINYFQIALKSASETIYWLSLIRELNPDEVIEIDRLIDECTQLKKILSTIILNTRNNSRL